MLHLASYGVRCIAFLKKNLLGCEEAALKRESDKVKAFFQGKEMEATIPKLKTSEYMLSNTVGNRSQIIIDNN